MSQGMPIAQNLEEARKTLFMMFAVRVKTIAIEERD